MDYLIKGESVQCHRMLHRSKPLFKDFNLIFLHSLFNLQTFHILSFKNPSYHLKTVVLYTYSTLKD